MSIFDTARTPNAYSSYVRTAPVSESVFMTTMYG